MANHVVRATLQIRHDLQAEWIAKNPILNAGEYGLETDTFLLKVGNGVTDWQHLRYLNKLDPRYFEFDSTTNQITFSAEFLQIISTLEAAAGEAIDHLTINDQPVNDTDAANKKYVDDAIAAAGHLKRAIVQVLPAVAEADPDTLYMVLAQSGDHYDEYMIINGAWDVVGSTGDGGSGGFLLEIATSSKLGGVKSAPVDGEGKILTDKDYVVVNPTTGFMTLNQVSTSLLYVPTGDTLVLYGGTA